MPEKGLFILCVLRCWCGSSGIPVVPRRYVVTSSDFVSPLLSRWVVYRFAFSAKNVSLHALKIIMYNYQLDIRFSGPDFRPYTWYLDGYRIFGRIPDFCMPCWELNLIIQPDTWYKKVGYPYQLTHNAFCFEGPNRWNSN